MPRHGLQLAAALLFEGAALRLLVRQDLLARSAQGVGAALQLVPSFHVG